MNRHISNKQLTKAITSANYNFIHKWYNDKEITIDDLTDFLKYDHGCGKMIQTSYQKDDFELYYFLFEIINDINILPFKQDIMLKESFCSNISSNKYYKSSQ